MTRIRDSVGTFVVCVVNGVAGASPAAHAQATDGSDGPVLEEVVVTALKRAESLQDIPASITALSSDQLATLGLRSPTDVAAQVANLQATSVMGGSTPIFSLRGVSMNDFSQKQSSPVASYIDEVYKGNIALFGVQMFDLERVEVLRGPQGTLALCIGAALVFFLPVRVAAVPSHA
jgi:iron complex outermembrane recepter protein